MSGDNTYELIQALLLHGNLDIPSVISLKKCAKTFDDVITSDTIKNISEHDRTSSIMWLARLANPNTRSFDEYTLKDIREKVMQGNVDTIHSIFDQNNVYFDLDIQDKLLNMCFNFDMYESKYNIDNAFGTFCGILFSKFDKWNNEKTNKDLMITAYTLFAKLIFKIVHWSIRNNVQIGEMNLITHKQFISSVKYKTHYILGFTNYNITLKNCEEIREILLRTEKYAKAWYDFLMYGTKVHIGPKGGLFHYVNHGKSRRKVYWK